MTFFLAFLVLSACRSTTVGPHPKPDQHDTTTPDPWEDTAPPEQVPGAEDPSADLWGLDRIHTVDLEIPEDSMAVLRTTPSYSGTEFVVASMVFDGERVDDIGIHLKGRWGSWRSMDGKAAFKIDINKFIPDQHFHGLEKLTFNNMIVDCSWNREQLGFYILQSLGLVGSRVGYVWLRINGEDFGLYLNVESVDDVFLDHGFTEPDGNLYEADYVIWPNGSYTLVDFDSERQRYFQLQEGTDVKLADVEAVTEALQAPGDDLEETLGGLVDLPTLQLTIAMEVLIGHIDGYSMNDNNFYIYFNPDDGKVELLTWDLDYAFLDESSWGFSWNRPVGLLTNACISDRTCHAQTREVLADAIDAFEAMDLNARLQEGIDLVNPVFERDPRRECSAGSRNSYQDQLWAWIGERPEHVRREWGI